METVQFPRRPSMFDSADRSFYVQTTTYFQSVGSPPLYNPPLIAHFELQSPKIKPFFSLPCLFIFNQFDHCNGCIIGNSIDDNSWSFMHFIYFLLYSDFDCSLVFERSDQQTRSNSFMLICRYSNVSWCFTQVKIMISVKNVG